jgi:hypothetical protein
LCKFNILTAAVAFATKVGFNRLYKNKNEKSPVGNAERGFQSIYERADKQIVSFFLQSFFLLNLYFVVYGFYYI